MEEKKDFYQVSEDIYAKDNRYKPDSYEFVMQALHFTQSKLKKESHVSGKELLEGIRDFARTIRPDGQDSFKALGHY